LNNVPERIKTTTEKSNFMCYDVEILMRAVNDLGSKS